MKEKKILILSNHAVGLYNFRKELLIELVEKGYVVEIVCPSHPRLIDIKDIGCKVIELDVDRRGKSIVQDLKLIVSYLKIMMKIKPSLIMTYTIKPNIYGGIAARLLNQKTIANITGLGTVFQDKRTRTFKMILALYRYALHKTSFVFFQNELNKEIFEKYSLVDSDQIVRVNGSGVNIDDFKMSISKKKSHDLEFVFISRVMKEKGIEEFLYAAKEVNRINPNIKFKIAGFYEENDYKNKIEVLESEHIVEYLGDVKDIKEVMANADCVVLPTYHEGMSNVLQEAAAMGIPTIASNIHGCKEIIDHERTGFLCEPMNGKDVLLKINQFIQLSDEERVDMGNNARKKMCDEFDRHIIVSKYMEKIKQVLQ